MCALRRVLPFLFAGITFWYWISTLKRSTMKPLSKRKPTNWQAFWVRKWLSSVFLGKDNIHYATWQTLFIWSDCSASACTLIIGVLVSGGMKLSLESVVAVICVLCCFSHFSNPKIKSMFDSWPYMNARTCSQSLLCVFRRYWRSDGPLHWRQHPHRPWALWLPVWGKIWPAVNGTLTLKK